MILMAGSHLIRRYFSTSPPPIINELVNNELYHQLLLHLHNPESPNLTSIVITLPSIIKACSYTLSTHFGLQLHCFTFKSGFDSDTVISNSLLTMYSKFSSPKHARQVFDTMLDRDTISWNSMINCYIRNGCFAKGLEMFKQMFDFHGFVSPNPNLIASVLSICTDFALARAIHALVRQCGVCDSVFLSTALVDMYMNFHDPLMAFRVFHRTKMKNEVSWTALISGCVANENYVDAIFGFQTMLGEGVCPNRVTIIAVLPACVKVCHVKEIHAYAVRRGFDSEQRFSSSLMKMYCQFEESLRYSKIIFEKTPEKDVVTWSSMIGCYSRNGDGLKAMNLSCQMRMEGTEPNSVTLLAMISACTIMSSLKHGRAVHDYVIKSGMNSVIFIGNSLINMYSKCGSLLESQQIFNEMELKDRVSWSALISACGQHGCGEQAMKLFHQIQQSEIESDSITFLAVLSACNYAGLVSEGQNLFNNAKRDNKIQLSLEHYDCYIDLLGRSGNIKEACEVVCMMPMEPKGRIWSSLISACKSHGRMEIAEMLAHKLIKAEPGFAGNYTLLSMVYAETGNWLGVEEVRKIMRGRGLRKSFGFSRI